jgi:hypothetical protein
VSTWNLTHSPPPPSRSSSYTPPPSSSSGHSLLLALHRWRMPSNKLDDNPFSFKFLAEFLAAFDFGGFEPTDSLLFNFGFYEHEFNDASFLFSVESYVGFGNHHRHRRKKCRPNRQYRRRSVKTSCWYREFLRPGTTRDLTGS